LKIELACDDHFEDAGLNVFQVDRARISTSYQTLEKLAGHQQITLEAKLQLRK